MTHPRRGALTPLMGSTDFDRVNAKLTAIVASRGHQDTPASARPARRATATVSATPLVRKLARDNGVALASVTGTGPGGRITRADIATAAARQSGSLPQAHLATSLRSPEDALYELVYGPSQASATSTRDPNSLDALVAEAERTA